MSPFRVRLQKTVLLAPDPVARAAAARVSRPEEAWLLRQPRSVRRSYAREVLTAAGRGGAHGGRADEIWMLRQPRAVRETYVREVLGG